MRPPTEAIGETDVTSIWNAAGAPAAAGTGYILVVASEGTAGVVAVLGRGENGKIGEEKANKVDEPIHRVVC